MWHFFSRWSSPCAHNKISNNLIFIVIIKTPSYRPRCSNKTLLLNWTENGISTESKQSSHRKYGAWILQVSAALVHFLPDLVPPITTLLCLDINRDFMPNLPSVCNVNREWIHPNPNTRQDCVIVCFTHNNNKDSIQCPACLIVWYTFYHTICLGARCLPPMCCPWRRCWSAVSGVNQARLSEKRRTDNQDPVTANNCNKSLVNTRFKSS